MPIGPAIGIAIRGFTLNHLVDKISILELKHFHMEKQIHRKDALPEHKERCQNRLAIIKEQRSDLMAELSELSEAVIEGRKKLKVYRQFKMYNDPSYRS